VIYTSSALVPECTEEIMDDETSASVGLGFQVLKPEKQIAMFSTYYTFM
jgi:hypothetical protein